jgi:COX assembly protein 1
MFFLDYSNCSSEGDPNDRTLRRLEADVIIPNRMNRQINKEECRETYLEMIKCLKKEGDVHGLTRCQGVLDVYNGCKRIWFQNPTFRQAITDEYLEERSQLRRTGLTPKQRELERFREDKKKQSVNNICA